MAFPQTAFASAITGAFAGQSGDSSNKQDDSFINGETSAEIPFGVVVQQGTADNECKLLSATNNVLVGVTLHSNAYAPTTELGTTGVKINVPLNVRSQGRVWVTVEEAVTPASNVLVRAVATGNEVAGAFRDTADASDCIDISGFARYLTSAGAGELALVEFDFRVRSA